MIDLDSYFGPSIEDDDDYRNANIAMINWLDRQSPDTWVAIGAMSNWDYCVPTMHWLVDQPSCDLVLAAMIFWLGADSILNPGMTPERAENDSEARLLTTILRRMANEGYTSDYSIPEGEVRARLIPTLQDYEHPIQIPCMPGFTFPLQLFGPFGSRTAILPELANPFINPVVWDLFCALGTTFGDRPGSGPSD